VSIGPTQELSRVVGQLMRTSPRLAAVALDDFGGALGLHAHGQATVVVGLADLGQRTVPAGAVQQAHAQALLQVGDAPAELDLGMSSARPAGAKPPCSTTWVK
jgi:hypothetical protein